MARQNQRQSQFPTIEILLAQSLKYKQAHGASAQAGLRLYKGKGVEIHPRDMERPPYKENQAGRKKEPELKQVYNANLEESCHTQSEPSQAASSCVNAVAMLIIPSRNRKIPCHEMILERCEIRQ